MLWPPTIGFELHAEMAEEIDLVMCSYGQLSEVQMLRDLDHDLGWGHGHINIHSTCRTSSVPNHVTVAHALPKYGHLNFVKYRHWDFLEGNYQWQNIMYNLS